MTLAKKLLSFKVNGRDYDLAVRPNATLLETLREELQLHGAKEGCGEGVLRLLHRPDRRRPGPGLPDPGPGGGRPGDNHHRGPGPGRQADPGPTGLHRKRGGPVRLLHPGMILTAHALLSDNPDPTEGQVRAALAGQICRCTGYAKIVEAVLTAAEWLKAEADK